MFQVSMPGKLPPNPQQQVNFFTQLQDRIHLLPGVAGAAYASAEPLSSGSSNSVAVEGRPAPPPQQAEIDTAFTRISPNYFEVMEMPLIRGRHFDQNDSVDAAKVTVVNDAFVKRYFPAEDPIGKHVRANDSSSPWLTVVGVVGNTQRFDVFHEMGFLSTPQIYLPFAQDSFGTANFVVRATGEPRALLPAVRRAAAEQNGSVALRRYRTIDDKLAEITSAPRFRAVLLGAFAGLALLLAAVGVYGVLAQSVAQRRHEIGVRMALGAERGRILRLVMSQGMQIISLGVALGLGGALALSRVFSAFLFGVRATDPVFLCANALLIGIVAALATYIPARRAAAVDPIVALKYE
jgi:putative ABC transport system permease protein